MVLDWILNGGLIALLLGIVIFFIKKWIDEVDKISINLTEITNGMNDNINSMKTLIAVMEANIENQNEVIEKQFVDNQKWLAEHEETIKIHTDRLSKLEVFCKIKHNDKKD